jgi:hypothetical protein
MVSLGLQDNYDLSTFAGTILDLVHDGEAARQFILKQFRIALKHQIKIVYLINHLDCTAYGGHEAFPSLAEERKRHIDDMKKAVAIINDEFPGLEVKMLLAYDGDDAHFEEVN